MQCEVKLLNSNMAIISAEGKHQQMHNWKAAALPVIVNLKVRFLGNSYLPSLDTVQQTKQSLDLSRTSKVSPGFPGI